MVDHLDRRRRVVDRRRERLDRDVDHDPHRERGILLDRPLDAEDDHPPEVILVSVTGRLASVDPDHGRSGRDEVSDRVVENERAPALPREPDESGGVDRLDRAGAARAHDRRRLAGDLQRPAHDLGRVGPGRRSDGRFEGLPARGRRVRRHGHRSQAVDEAVEEEEEEEEVRGHQDARHGDADMWNGALLDSRQQREGERERPDQHRQQDVQHPVPVPEPHVARREHARRHLHDEDADGDDESGQRRGRAHDRGEEDARGRCRVLQRQRHGDSAREHRLEQPEQGPRDPAQQREEPEAPLQVLAGLEVERPHGMRFIQRPSGPRTSSRRDDVTGGPRF